MHKWSELRARSGELGKGRGRRYPAELRDELLRAVAEMREQGASWPEMSRALGVTVETLRRWWSEPKRNAASPAALVPVEISTPLVGSSLVLVTPGGLRVEGLDVTSAALLLRALS